MWVRHVILELAVTVVIALATIPDLAWARWLVIIYTILMLVLKATALVGRRTLISIRPTNPDVPGWFWHLNYAVNIGLLLADQWWLMATAWIVIWGLSIVFERYVNPTIRS